MTKKPIKIPEVIRKINIVLNLFGNNSLSKDGLHHDEAFKITNLLFENETPKITHIDSNEFGRIIEKLMKDGFVVNEIGTKYEVTYEGRLEANLGGYSEKFLEMNQNAVLQKNQQAIETRMFWLTVAIALGAFLPAMLAGADLFWKYHWFRSCFWWIVSLTVVLLAALTSYLIWSLLQQKKQPKVG